MLENEEINNNYSGLNKIEDQLDKTQAEKKFYEEKLKNITEGGIYQLVYGLCQSFCRGDEYKVNCHTENKFNNSEQERYDNFKSEYSNKCDTLKDSSNVFKAPDFSFPKLPKNNKKDSLIGKTFTSLFANETDVRPFIFFEMVDPNQFTENVKNNSEAVANYVKQFAYCLSQLLCNAQFIDFLISNDKNMEVLEKIIASDFVIKGDKANPELFRNSNLLFVGSKLVNKYRLYLEPYADETDDYKKMREVKCKPLILNYLDKSFAISNGALSKLLFESDFYNIFAQADRIGEIVINAVKKTDFHFTIYESKCDSISGLNSLLRKRDEKDLNDEKDETKGCFWKKYCNQIDGELANKCAEIFSNSDESVEINLYTLTEKYKYLDVCKFMSNYLSNEEQKNSKIGKNLIQALKKWLANEKLLLWKHSFEPENLDTYATKLDLFLRDDDLKKSFANACIRTIKHLIDTASEKCSWNLLRCQEEFDDIKTKSKLFLDKFGITLENYDFSNEPYKTHGKNIAWLSLWIFLFLVCIAAMKGIYIVMPILILKYILFIPMFAIALKGTERIVSIIDDRIYNAKLDIYKSGTKIDAENKLYWDMSKIDEVKQCLNARFPDVEKKNNEENNNLIDN